MEKKMRKLMSPLLMLLFWSLTTEAQPQFEVDPTWPKPLPETWINGQIGGVCVDSHDHIVIVDRRNINDEEMQTGRPADTLMMFDMEGNLVNSWGDPNLVPQAVHGCSFDTDDNVYIGGNQDAIVQKYSHDGELLLQIGTKRLFDTEDGTRETELKNSSRTLLHRPSGAVVDPENGDIYISDGYGNKRVVVFDSEGNYLRQWGRHATAQERSNPPPGAFAEVVHCIAMSNEGLIYVCDRPASRVQVFDKTGNHIRDIRVARTDDYIEDPINRGTTWWVAFSPDEDQEYLYIMNGAQEQVHVLDHETGENLSHFGRPGHQLGYFTHGHTLDTDSHGNLYVAETSSGRRVQRFNLVSD